MMRPLEYIREWFSFFYDLRWVQTGMPSPMPPSVVRRMIHRFMRDFGYSVFVETGTGKGDTLASIALLGVRTISVEIERDQFQQVNQRFNGWSNIELHCGDSAEVLPRIIATLQSPALFWLDACEPLEEDYEQNILPIAAELQAIFSSPIDSHLILINRAHAFTGENGYPELTSLLMAIKRNKRYQIYVHADIVVIYPASFQIES